MLAEDRMSQMKKTVNAKDPGKECTWQVGEAAQVASGRRRQVQDEVGRVAGPSLWTWYGVRTSLPWMES